MEQLTGESDHVMVTLAIDILFYSHSELDECDIGNHGCHMDASCSNQQGGFLCTCRVGYSGDGYTCAGEC